MFVLHTLFEAVKSCSFKYMYMSVFTWENLLKPQGKDAEFYWDLIERTYART